MDGLKNLFLTIVIMGCCCVCFGQIDSINQPESTRLEQPKPPVIAPPVSKPVNISRPVKKKKIDSVIRKTTDTLARDTGITRISRITKVMTKFHPDSLVTDSAKKNSAVVLKRAKNDTGTYQKYETHPYLPLNRPAVFMVIDYHKQPSKDELFYLMAAILFCLAFIRAGFPKYFRNLFLLFFQTSLRQKQNRDHLLQDHLASLLTNLLFFISTGLYITLLIQYKNWIQAPFWILALVSALALVLIYLGKYLFLLFAGWVFNTKEAAGSYVFLVFLVNKVMGVLLIPFLLILAFADPRVVNIAVTVSFGMIGLLFLYRYGISFSAIRTKLKVNALHFFLYLCAVELLPLLLIYKVLMNYIAGSF